MAVTLPASYLLGSPNMMKKAAQLALVLPALVLLGACSSDDGGGDSAAAPAESECEIVGGTDTEATTELHVTLDEWKIESDATTVAAGPVHIEATNAGEDDHEVVLVKGATPDQLTITADGLDEEALPEGAEVLGEIEGFPGGDECAGTFELTAGSYALVCNIVEESEHEAHAQLGMVTALTVT
jgi:plastocyanin